MNDIAKYLSRAFAGKAAVHLEEMWALLDEHPIFPSEEYRDEIKKALVEVYGATKEQVLNEKTGEREYIFSFTQIEREYLRGGRENMSKALQQFGGSWTKDKLDIFTEYLNAYLTALQNQKFKKIYIDAFAGTGEITTSDGGQRLIGSAKRALSAGLKFDSYYFIE